MNLLKKIGRRLSSTIAYNALMSRYDDPVSMEDVLNCYRYILGREPENAAVVAEALEHHQSFHQLRNSFFGSPEFRSRYKELEHETQQQPPFIRYQTPAVAFIHLVKTAGSTFHSLLEQQFPRDRICPLRYNHLDSYAAAELSRFDFFSGHFDWFSTKFIPRESVKRIAFFRKPQDRLISFYRFVKSHPPTRDYENYLFVQAAHEMSVEEFFEHPKVRSTPEICNHYLLAFGLAYATAQQNWPPKPETVTSAIMDRAIRRVRALDGVGISECFDESVALIFQSLGMPIPDQIQHLQVTDKLPHLDPKYTPVSPVTKSARLVEALKDLTFYDDIIYREALTEFESRRKHALEIGCGHQQRFAYLNRNPQFTTNSEIAGVAALFHKHDG